MAYKMIMTIIVAIAIIIAILSLIPNHFAVALVVFTSRFFAVMIPVLAVGGLLKWILGCNGSNKD